MLRILARKDQFEMAYRGTQLRGYTEKRVRALLSDASNPAAGS